MIKLLIGGSPCTFWSIAQKNGRETEAEGMGWELFKNYLIAKEKFKPDFFLYENNKSAAQAIKDQISHELGVDLMHINSALVSAQNRQRFYAFNWEVEQPEDRGILLRDILETHTDEQPYELQTVGVGYRNRREDDGRLYRRFETSGKEKANALTTVQTDSMVAEPIRIGDIGSTAQAHRVYSCDGKSVTINAGGGGQGGKTGLYLAPLPGFAPGETTKNSQMEFLGGIVGNREKWVDDGKSYSRNFSQGHRLYGTNGKAVTLTAQACGHAGNTGAYVIPCECEALSADSRNYIIDRLNNRFVDQRGRTIPVYEVKEGRIAIKGKQYPIKLEDGYYIIRKLTPVECERLQTLPDNYTAAVSNAQRYKGLGNGWTAEVIIHILNGALKDAPRDEEIVVLSMYDGIGTGRYCLDKMGFTNVKYFAYEIDKYAKEVALSNYPDIIHCGDAFDLRHPDWTIGY